MVNVLVTGANRGIGLELVRQYASRPGYTVIAAVRDRSKMPSVATFASGSRVFVVKLDSRVREDAKAAVEAIQQEGVEHLDIVIANAGIKHPNTPLHLASIDQYQDMWDINVWGSLALYQATIPIIPKGGKFIFTTSTAGLISNEKKMPDTGYGMSKSGNVFMARHAHFEQPDHIIFALHPGWVKTDMGTTSAKSIGLDLSLLVEPEESAASMIKTIDEATRETCGGLPIKFDGTKMDW